MNVLILSSIIFKELCNKTIIYAFFSNTIDCAKNKEWECQTIYSLCNKFKKKEELNVRW